MAQNDAANNPGRPLPGHETQSGEMTCPACGRFVGAATKCPYCGAKVEKRMSLVAIRWAAVLLATVGLVLLYFMARTRDPERIRIGDIETTMNFGLVRLSGEVRNNPRPFKNGNGMSFHVSDGSGSIIVFLDQSQVKAMTEGDLLPKKGDAVDFIAQLQSSSSGNSARIRSLNPESYALTRADGAPARNSSSDSSRRSSGNARDFGPAVPFAAIDESLVGQSVTLEGTLAAIKEPPPDTKRPYVLTLANGADRLDVKVWPDQYRKIDDLLSLTGTPVRVRAAVKLYREQVELQLRKGSDLQSALPSPAPRKARRPVVPVAEAIAVPAGGYATVEGALSAPVDRAGKGTAYTLTDGTGSITAILWNDAVPPDLQRRAAAAARVRVNGKVTNFRGTIQITPRAGGLEVLE